MRLGTLPHSLIFSHHPESRPTALSGNMVITGIMPESHQILDRLRGLIGRSATFRGGRFRVVEVLERPSRLVLESLDPKGSIVSDMYGHPTARGRSFLELSVFDEENCLSREIREVELAEPVEPD